MRCMTKPQSRNITPNGRIQLKNRSRSQCVSSSARKSTPCDCSVATSPGSEIGTTVNWRLNAASRSRCCCCAFSLTPVNQAFRLARSRRHGVFFSGGVMTFDSSLPAACIVASAAAVGAGAGAVATGVLSPAAFAAAPSAASGAGLVSP